MNARHFSLSTGPEHTKGLQIVQIERLLSTYFADGISHSGARLVSQSNLPFRRMYKFRNTTKHAVEFPGLDERMARSIVRLGEPLPLGDPASQPSAKFVMEAFFSGYAMAMTGWFDYFSAVILLVHVAIAIFFFFWVVLFGRTGDSWDTPAELLAQAFTSPPLKGGELL